ncbi:hypothetical protein [Dictyobacter arantiisoli]|uniref:HD domain-containing protein n=1 Tax=Dictyobacter arantiisoli TaxID=2014874 RepID=A0A5A5TD97_9CHLR|nr:hypothetical protein [Dictyobacter arantiisoli]GCF09013.1 hypothetical protein KDI_25770 [Dictyobacter arantiisoli]
MKMVLKTVRYRLRQVRQQLGFVPPLTRADDAEVARWLPASALPLFYTMSTADQQHSLRVCRGLLAGGNQESDLLAAALLHDVGKAEGRVPFWTRPVIVLGKHLAPSLLRRTVMEPDNSAYNEQPHWRQALSYAWHHAAVGARLAEQVGLSERAILYIRTHHQPHGPAAALYHVDEIS